MPKVFITQFNPKLNYSKAARFGELVPMSGEGEEVWADKVGESTNAMSNKIDEALDKNKFDPAKDFILLSGDPVSIAIATMYVNDLNPEGYSISFLKYSNTLKDYFVVEV